MLEEYCGYSLKLLSRLKGHSGIGVAISSSSAALQNTKIHATIIFLQFPMPSWWSQFLVEPYFFTVYLKTWGLQATIYRVV